MPPAEQPDAPTLRVHRPPDAVPDQQPELLAAVLGELQAIHGAIRQPGLPQLLGPDDAARFIGVSRSGFYRLVAADELPRPIEVPGSGPKWRTSDLSKWIAALKPAKRRPRRIKTTA